MSRKSKTNTCLRETAIARSNLTGVRFGSRDWICALLLVVVTMLAYQPAWNGKPIWDDNKHITRPDLRSLDGLVRIWTEPGASQQYYPLAHSFFWMEHRLWGNRPLGYHLINILLHTGCVLLLVKILRRLEVPGGWLAAAIFALHPVQVETVAWISELKNTLSGVCCLGAVLVYLNFDLDRKWTFYAGALGLFILGLMSKTVIATMPAALLVIVWWKRGRLSWKQEVLPLLPFFAVGIAAGLFTAWMERTFIGAKGSEFNFSVIERCLIAGRAFWFYLGKLFWPANLVFIYPRWNVRQAVWWQYLFPAAALLLLAGFWLLRRRSRGPLAGLLFFAGTLFPALGFFNVYPFRYSFVADHFQYLAGIGPIVLATAGITLAFDSLGQRRPILKPAFWGPLLLALGLLTWRQCRMYADIETLWRVTIDRNPNTWMAHYNLGNFLVQKERVNEAIEQYQKALELKPNFAEIHNNLGLALVHEGKSDEAIAQFQKVLEIDPADAQGHSNLGLVLLQEGKRGEAIAHFQKALEISPNFSTAGYNLAQVAWMLATSPEASVRNGAKAIELAEEVERLSGGKDPIINMTLAAAYAEAGRYSEALATAQRAQQLAADQNRVPLIDAIRTQIGYYLAGYPFRDASQTNPISRIYTPR